ncbi:uncharacterized protein LOC119725801 [Patiria miniata]|uniref:Uncharacterized protein n=1 Tax=Patiria miniata TaxID=46514 RepID=A0A913ZND8_PATMI|nr:uncharacterized protein LOC119725801 [Patiria miniata]XP_038053308.1 uncharacterized protein LOC119725801 [Patiria miniata]
MAEKFANRVKELSSIYDAVSSANSSRTFGQFLKTDLTKDVLRKCSLTAIDLRYITLESNTQLYSFSGHWQDGIAAHVYSTRFDDPVPKMTNNASGDETSCARLFVTEKPIRVVSVQRNAMLELCKKWVRGHYDQGHAEGDRATNGEGDVVVDELPPAMPRNLFQRLDGLSFLDYVLYREHTEDFHSIKGVVFDDAPAAHPLVPSSRYLLLFDTKEISLLQELVYPAKKKLRKSVDGFLSCVSEPSRPQAPPMKRGRSVNTPPIPSHSPGGPPPPPPHQPKTHTAPPRPGTPTTSEEGKSPSKPQAAPRESTQHRETTPNKPPAPPKHTPSEETPKEVVNTPRVAHTMPRLGKAASLDDKVEENSPTKQPIYATPHKETTPNKPPPPPKHTPPPSENTYDEVDVDTQM